jgi:hypothetical protein
MFPLSGEHLWEISKIADPRQRGDLADILEAAYSPDPLSVHRAIADQASSHSVPSSPAVYTASDVDRLDVGYGAKGGCRQCVNVASLN